MHRKNAVAIGIAMAKILKKYSRWFSPPGKRKHPTKL